jgi:hypothetical protein
MTLNVSSDHRSDTWILVSPSMKISLKPTITITVIKEGCYPRAICTTLPLSLISS